MGWTVLSIVVAVVVAFLLLRNRSQISLRAARAHLQQGAIVVDVRTNAEFQSHHLPNALHIPLEEIDSLAARRRLLQLGYKRVFNLGSYARAARIVGNG